MWTSVKFDVGKAQRLAQDRRWTLDDWADIAGVSEATLRAFLQGSPRQKLLTVEKIVSPLGIRAYDLILAMPPLPSQPEEPVLVGEPS